MDTCTFIFKVSSTRRGQPRFHCSQGFINKTRAATLSFQSKFHQQDGGSHAFIPAEFINKYIQTNIHSLTEDPCIFYLFWDKPFTCSHTIITYAAGYNVIVALFVDDSRLSWNMYTLA